MADGREARPIGGGEAEKKRKTEGRRVWVGRIGLYMQLVIWMNVWLNMHDVMRVVVRFNS
jgi:hypothetical protein